MSSINLETRFVIEMYIFNKEKRCNAFPRSTDIIQVLKELPIDNRHIKDARSVSLYPYNRSQILPYVKFIANFCDK